MTLSVCIYDYKGHTYSSSPVVILLPNSLPDYNYVHVHVYIHVHNTINCNVIIDQQCDGGDTCMYTYMYIHVWVHLSFI